MSEQLDVFTVPWEVRGHPWSADWWVVTEGWKPGGDVDGGKVCAADDLAIAVRIALRHNADIKSDGGRPRIPLNQDVIRGALGRGGSVAGAAAILNISPRTLRRRINDLIGHNGGGYAPDSAKTAGVSGRSK